MFRGLIMGHIALHPLPAGLNSLNLSSDRKSLPANGCWVSHVKRVDFNPFPILLVSTPLNPPIQLALIAKKEAGNEIPSSLEPKIPFLTSEL